MHQADPSTEFLRFASAGDTLAFERVLAHASGPAYQQARRALGNHADAEDAVQEAFLQLARSAQRYDGSIPFPAWMGRLVYLACLRVRRARRHRQREHAMTTEPLAKTGDADLGEAVRAAVLRLPERYRAPIVLHYFAGLPYEQAAAALSLSASALGVRLYRARERLRRLLAGTGIEVPGETVASMLTLATAYPLPPAIAEHAANLTARLSQGIALPSTSMPLTLTAQAALLMATSPILALSLALSLGLGLCLGAISVPLVLHAQEPSAAPTSGALPGASDPLTADQGHRALSLADLAAMQGPDGSWDEATILAGLGVGADGERLETTEQATALACRCFLERGDRVVPVGAYAQPVARALGWLRARQRPDGGFSGSRGDSSRVLLALLDGEIARPDPAGAFALQRGVDFLRTLRQDSAGHPRWGIDRAGERIDIRDATAGIMALVRARTLGLVTPDDLADSRSQLIATWEAANPQGARGELSSDATYPLQADAVTLASLGGRALTEGLALASLLGPLPLPDPPLPPLLLTSLRHGLGDLDRLDPCELYLACLSAQLAGDAPGRALAQQCSRFLHDHLITSGALTHWWGGKRIPSRSRFSAALYVVLALQAAQPVVAPGGG